MILECPPQNFADHGFREIPAELDLSRDLVRREPFAAEGAQLGLGRLLAAAEDDPRTNHFALGLVRHSRHTDFRDRRMCRDYLFDLARPDLVTAGLDQVLLAV